MIYLLYDHGADYLVSINAEGVTMVRSGEQWTERSRGTTAINMDIGDGEVEIKIGKRKKIKLDVCELHELYNMLHLYSKVDPFVLTRLKAFREDK